MKLRLTRLFTYPSAHVLSVAGDVTRVRIDGLVCDRVCAARSHRALARIEGVRSVSIDFDAGIATVEGPAAPGGVYARAIDGAAAGRPLRRALDALRRALPRRADRGERTA
ncbi:MAG: cation transporter [Chloroflexota bacterium]|nr:cation transporter [Chloroflexota bacterium]